MSSRVASGQLGATAIVKGYLPNITCELRSAKFHINTDLLAFPIQHVQSEGSQEAVFTQPLREKFALLSRYILEGLNLAFIFE